MANRISIIITAQDEASRKLAGLAKSLDQTSSAGERSASVIQRVQNTWYAFAGITAAAGAGLHQMTGSINENLDAATRLQGALTGLNSVARAFHQDAGAAQEAAEELASDGLMTVAHAATGLKNLLATGFSLDQAVTLMRRFKDSAAFGRQSALSFGDAVSSATEGIKNGNSILVDNAGVTKNLSLILREMGFAEQDVMRASSDAAVRLALFNGIVKETNPQVGDATRLAEQYAGKQAQLKAQTTVLRQEIGQALQPALLTLFATITPMVVAIGNWVSQHQTLAAVLIFGTTIILGVVTAVGALGVAIATITPALPVLAAVATSAFGAISAGAAGAHGAVAALTAFVGGPAALGAWGVFAAAAIGAFVLIQNKARETSSVLDETLRRIQGVQKGDEAAIRVLQQKANEARARGDQATANKYAQQIRSIYGSIPGYAMGGFTGRGSANELAGVVHKGEYVVPKSQVDQNTGQPKGAGGDITVINHVYNQVDMDAVVRDLSWRLKIA